jgi:hypothetical protein
MQVFLLYPKRSQNQALLILPSTAIKGPLKILLIKSSKEGSREGVVNELDWAEIKIFLYNRIMTANLIEKWQKCVIMLSMNKNL